MLALESSRQHQAAYLQPFTMDPTLIDPMAFHIDHLGAYTQDQEAFRLSQSYLDTSSLYAESTSDAAHSAGFSSMPATSPTATPHPPDVYLSAVSTASAPSIPSATSSTIGSPYSGTAPALHEHWVDTTHGVGLPAAVMGDLFPNEYMGNAMESDPAFYHEKIPDIFISAFSGQRVALQLPANTPADPSVIPMQRQPYASPMSFQYPEQPTYPLMQPGFPPISPSASPVSAGEYLPAEKPLQPHRSPVAMSSEPHSRPVSISGRRSSVSSTHSRRSQHSAAETDEEGEEGKEGKEKGRCPHPDCGRAFKDLKAHMLTHQSERPEKCPIVTCEYHVKGFARKYDKNRHTLTHYKGTMVCGFCPGPGSPAEKSFNRADVFKRHLTSVHGVEQTPPNSRKKMPTASSNKKISDYCSDATGKCSTCSATFCNAQDFYEHLDDCVLRVVQQEEPSEAINQQRLAEVASDEEVKKTMEKHRLLDTAGTVDHFDDDNDDYDDDDSNELSSTPNWSSGRGSIKSTKSSGVNSASHAAGRNAVGKACSTASKRRRNRRLYPQSWGCPSSSMKTKKRILCVFDGRRRLWKDEMMLDSQFEVRLKLPGGAGDGTNREAYITDLDLETMKRVDGVLSASDEERGPWIDNQPSCLIGRSAVPLSDFQRHADDEVNLDEFMV
ncbi:hypothetical protein MPDQ_003587 [Monascus purpureus]|uniref:C2H2-type domain-containing protein n=1 Tax=Monascus purpureus TaxID=5098 RepID=A0A507QL46_MONPU|nr:hypothetical protein MPDQ_003587 [Monascus purpureus]BDD57712.1 hypothetical protein MAP00_003057 [Monascus purpureus]